MKKFLVFCTLCCMLMQSCFAVATYPVIQQATGAGVISASDTGYQVGVVLAGLVETDDIVGVDITSDALDTGDYFAFSDDVVLVGSQSYALVTVDVTHAFSGYTGDTLWINVWTETDASGDGDDDQYTVSFQGSGSSSSGDLEAIFDAVAAALLVNGIESNLSGVTISNVSNFGGLYFATDFGEIEFMTGLDLTDDATIDFLEDLENALDMDAGYISFSPQGSGDAFNIDAELTMYFTGQVYPAGSGDVADIIVMTDTGLVLDGTTFLSDFVCSEFTGGEQTCSFITDHFTSFTLSGSAECGNTVIDAGEACDDGNTENGDGCSADCLYLELCGDGYVDADGADNIDGSFDDEQCDDGNHINGDGCSGVCEIELFDLMVEKVMTGSYPIGEEIQYWIQYTNNSAYTVSGVMVTDTWTDDCSDVFVYGGSNPVAYASGGGGGSGECTYSKTWNIGAMGPYTQGNILLTGSFVSGTGYYFCNEAMIEAIALTEYITGNNLDVLCGNIGLAGELLAELVLLTGSTDKSHVLVGGTMSPFVASYRLTALHQDILVKDILLVTMGDNFDQAIDEVILYESDGVTELARVTVNGSNLIFDNSNFVIEAGSSETIYVRLETNLIGDNHDGLEADDLRMSLAITDAEEENGGGFIELPSATDFSLPMYVRTVRISEVDFVYSHMGVAIENDLIQAGSNNLAILKVTTDTWANTDVQDGSDLDLCIQELTLNLADATSGGITGLRLEKIGGVDNDGIAYANYIGQDIRFDFADFSSSLDACLSSASSAYYVIEGIPVLTPMVAESITVDIEDLDMGSLVYQSDDSGTGLLTPFLYLDYERVDGVTIDDGELPICGNNYVESGEECDDGNSIDDDDCSNTCASNIDFSGLLCELFLNTECCGNAYLNVSRGEQCDDGNLNNFDDCDNQCQIHTGQGDLIAQSLTIDGGVSGTLVVGQSYEVESVYYNSGTITWPEVLHYLDLDPGYRPYIDITTGALQSGLQIRDNSEGLGWLVIDDSVDSSSMQTVTGTFTILPGFSGDSLTLYNFLLPQDSDNNISLAYEETVPYEFSGDIANPQQNNRLEISFAVEGCGNYIIDSGEVCDDGNTTNGDGCSDDCMEIGTCMDGYVDLDGADNIPGTADDEQCDDGNDVSGDGCTAWCMLETAEFSVLSMSSNQVAYSPSSSGYYTYYNTWFSVTGGAVINPVVLQTIPEGIGCLSAIWLSATYADFYTRVDSGSAWISRDNATSTCTDVYQIKTILGSGYNGGSLLLGLHFDNDNLDDEQYCVDVLLSADNAQYLETEVCNTHICGDSLVTGREQCDDGNAVAGDGCHQCDLEPTASVMYDVTTLTNGPVRATLTGASETIVVTNNNGNTGYTFTGNGEFVFTFEDGVGNTGAATATVDWIDTTVPELSISSPVSGTLVAGSTITMRGAVSDANGIAELFVGEDTASRTGTAWLHEFTLRGGGEHSIGILARDTAGNETDVTIDLVRVPVVSNVDHTYVEEEMFSVSFEVDVSDAAGVLYGLAPDDLDEQEWASSPVNNNPSANIPQEGEEYIASLEDLTQGETYYYQVYAVADGYTGALSEVDSFVVPNEISVVGATGTVKYTGAVQIAEASSTGVSLGTGSTLVIHSDTDTGTYISLPTGASVQASGWNGIISAPASVNVVTGIDIPDDGFGAVTGVVYEMGSDQSELVFVGGEVAVTFFVGTAYNGQTLRVYRSTDAGANYSYFQKECTITAGYCSFTTDRFSLYTVAVEEEEEVSTGGDTGGASSSAGGGGGGGGGRSADSCPDGDTSGNRYDGRCEAETEEGTGVDAIDEAEPEVISSVTTTATYQPGSIENSPYDTETNEAYLYAHAKGITTMPSIQGAAMTKPIIRMHLAKMIAQFATEVRGLTPDTTITCAFNDTENLDEEMQRYTTLACQLGLMGYSKGEVDDVFNPRAEVTRAQFATVFSRLLRGTTYDNNTNEWYADHMQALNAAGIMKKIDNPQLLERRGWIMLMMLRVDTLVVD